MWFFKFSIDLVSDSSPTTTSRTILRVFKDLRRKSTDFHAAEIYCLKWKSSRGSSEKIYREIKTILFSIHSSEYHNCVVVFPSSWMLLAAFSIPSFLSHRRIWLCFLLLLHLSRLSWCVFLFTRSLDKLSVWNSLILIIWQTDAATRLQSTAERFVCSERKIVLRYDESLFPVVDDAFIDRHKKITNHNFHKQFVILRHTSYVKSISPIQNIARGVREKFEYRKSNKVNVSEIKRS